VQRVAAILLLLTYGALGSGALEHFHNAQHAAEDARLMSAAQAAGTPLDHLPLHDDSNCLFHAQMHLSMLAVGWTPLLICLGLFVAFLSLLTSRLKGQPAFIAIPCRGPPIR
jgi:hypothetical protein